MKTIKDNLNLATPIHCKSITQMNKITFFLLNTNLKNHFQLDHNKYLIPLRIKSEILAKENIDNKVS